jgi:hypothetical protein
MTISYSIQQPRVLVFLRDLGSIKNILEWYKDYIKVEEMNKTIFYSTTRHLKMVDT